MFPNYNLLLKINCSKCSSGAMPIIWPLRKLDVLGLSYITFYMEYGMQTKTLNHQRSVSDCTCGTLGSRAQYVDFSTRNRMVPAPAALVLAAGCCCHSYNSNNKTWVNHYTPIIWSRELVTRHWLNHEDIFLISFSC